MADINNDMASKQAQYCKHCGKEIDSDSLYCRYCGKKQNLNKSFSFPKLSLPCKESWMKFLRGCFNWAIVAAICFGLGLIICYCIGDDAVDETPLKGWGYVLPPFIAYILYRILAFVYSLKGKKKAIVAACLGILAITLMGAEAYAAVKSAKQLEQEYQSARPDSINRTFLGCSFGDSYFQVEKVLNAKALNPQSKLSHNGNKQLFVTNTQYGGYDVDSIFITFLDDRMFHFMISINTIEFDDYRSNYTYNSLRDLLESKYHYKKDLSNHYDNSLKYSDDSTEVELWHKANKDGYEKYIVTLSYYDKTSGYKEERDKGF